MAITLSSPLFSGILFPFPGPVLEPISPLRKAAASSEPPAFTSCYLLGSCKTREKRHHLIPEGNTERSLDGEQGGGSVRKVIICDCPRAPGTPGCSLRYKQERSCGGSRLLGALRQLWAQISEHRFGALPGLPSSRWNEAAEDRTVGTHT